VEVGLELDDRLVGGLGGLAGELRLGQCVADGGELVGVNCEW